MISPLIIGNVDPDPTPVKGADGQFHVAYELTVLNFAPRPATITSVETLRPDGGVVTSLSREQVAARTMIVADYAGSQTAEGDDGGEVPHTWIAAGKTALLILDDAYPTRDAIPGTVTHRISATFGPAESGEGAIAVLWPDQATQTGGPVTITADEPVQIGAPLTGPGWFITAGCCTLNAHRDVMLPVNDRINGAERFAIDAVQLDVAAAEEHGLVDDVVLRGDPSKNENYLAYGAAILAVADGTVVQVEGSVPDTPAGSLPLGPGFTLANLGGNAVTVELTPDLYAVYYHLAPGSPTVKVGDKVTKGQVIAKLGNSGNSSEAHLHFQLSRTPSIFSSDSVPYVFDTFSVVGTVDEASRSIIHQPAPGPPPSRAAPRAERRRLPLTCGVRR
jgi:biotin carboxyl carrier protein